MERPTISADDAVSQAGTTIGQYLTQAISEIDQRFGEGYAQDNPALVAECVRSQTMDLNSVALTAVLYEIRDALEAKGKFPEK
jgi:hypothetical protein